MNPRKEIADLKDELAALTKKQAADFQRLRQQNTTLRQDGEALRITAEAVMNENAGLKERLEDVETLNKKLAAALIKKAVVTKSDIDNAKPVADIAAAEGGK